MCHVYADKNELIHRAAKATVERLVKEIAKRHRTDKDGEHIPEVYAIREDGLTFCVELGIRVDNGPVNPLITGPLRVELEAMGFSDITIVRKDGATRLMYSLVLEKELPVEVNCV